MTDKEAMKQALAALESCTPLDTSSSHVIYPWYDEKLVHKAITALKERLAQPEQEPVAWPIETNNQLAVLAKQCGWDNRRYITPADYQIWCDRMRQFVQLASPPAPQRKWVGLTDEEKLELYRQFENRLESDGWEYEKAIEAKLMEKNNA